MAEAALVLAPLDVLDPMKALRITLIANAFLEAQIEHLSAEVSAGYARCKKKK